MATITINKLIGGAITINSANGGGSGGSTTNYMWKDACNPDGSDLSDTEHAEWVFNDGQEHIIEYNNSMWLLWDENKTTCSPAFLDTNLSEIVNDSSAIILQNFEGSFSGIIAYRKYTPGHWEDADGNWVQGEWSEWSISIVKWYNVGEIARERAEDYVVQENEAGWWYQDFSAYNKDRNANLLWIEGPQTLITRQWNND